MNASFRKYAETLEKIEVLTVTITPEGDYNVPSERKGKIVQIDGEERGRLRQFFFEFACRMECGKLEDKEREELRLLLMQFGATLECPNPEHASPAAAAPKKARSA